jgi:hypothetical protein
MTQDLANQLARLPEVAGRLRQAREEIEKAFRVVEAALFGTGIRVPATVPVEGCNHLHLRYSEFRSGMRVAVMIRGEMPVPWDQVGMMVRVSAAPALAALIDEVHRRAHDQAFPGENNGTALTSRVMARNTLARA